VDRLENGLSKLYKVQGEVDVLMENAKVMAVEVEQKVAGANIFAEQVGIEKEKVNAENGGCGARGVQGGLYGTGVQRAKCWCAHGGMCECCCGANVL